MNLKSKWTARAALMAVTILCSTTSLQAALISFDLPVKAHWGNSTLEPGHYTMEVPMAISWPQQISVIQNNDTRRISPLIEESVNQSGQSYLRLVSVGGGYFVREYHSVGLGKRFTFGVPKAGSEQMRMVASIAVTETSHK